MSATFDPAELLAHAEGVRALARRLAGDDHAGDDVVQEACLVALTHPPAAGTPRRAWFVGVVRHLVHRLRRGDTRRSQRECAAARPEVVQPAAQAAGEIDAHRRVVEAVAALADPYRTAIVFRYLDGLTPREIAARLGVPDATVRTWIHRGLGMLRARLASERDDWRAALLPLFALPHKTVPPLVPVAGAIVMSVKKSLAVAVAVLLLIGGGLGVRAMMSGASSPELGPTAVASPRSRTPRLKSSSIDERSAVSPDTPLPAPVDLDKCDRDLDLHGVVVRKDGSPVPGAAVAVVSYPWRRASKLNSAGYDEAISGPSARTARDGTFALRLRRGECVALRVFAKGLAPVELALRQAGERVRVVLQEGVRLRITVIDERGAPVVGVPLQVFNQPGQLTSVRRDSTTGASGVAEIEWLPGGERLLIKSLARDRMQIPWQPIETPTEGEATKTIVLAAGSVLRGRVTDVATGAAVGGARIGVNSIEGLAVSLENGSYELPGLSGKGTESVQVVAEGYARASAAVGSQSTLDFSLRRGFALTGRVVGADGAPVAGALVAATATPFENAGASCFSAGFATTAADGRFRITSLDRELTHGVCVTATDRGRECLLVSPPAGDVELGDVILPTARAIEGRVLDSAGKAVAQIAVTALGPLGADGNGRSWRSDERFTDDLGRFRFHELAPGRHSVFATIAGAPRITTTVELPADHDVLDVALAVTATRTLIVRVSDDAGRPVRGAGVQTHGRNGSAFAQAETDGDGVARMAVGADTMYVAAYPAHGSPRDFLRCETQELKPDQTEAAFVFHEGSAIAGSVVDPDGKPVRHALVKVRCDGKSDQVVGTDDDGRFRVVVPHGATCSVAFDGIVMGRNTDLSGRVDAVLPGVETVVHSERVSTSRTLRVRVTDPSGAAVAGVHVWLGADYRGTTRGAVTDADGRAAFAGIPAREWSVYTASFGDWFGAAPQNVVPNGQEVVLALRNAPAVRGTVVAKDGAGMKAVVGIESRGRVLVTDVTTADGTFTIRVPPDDPGPFRVTARLPDSAPGTEAAAVEGVLAGASDVRIVLPR